MKRSEKEAEVRRLLETPETHLSGLSIGQTLTRQVFEMLVGKLVEREMPLEGWEPEIELPRRLKLAEDSRHLCADNGPNDGNNWWIAEVIVPVNPRHPGQKHCLQVMQAAIDAYNAMREAEEVEADPNDPLTVGLERLAAEEIAVLVADAAKVTREETIKQCASRYTREEFVELELQRSLGPENTGDIEDIDPDALTAIRRRAEWNAQAAERAGVVWCRQENGEVEIEQHRQVKEEMAPNTADEAWEHYCDNIPDNYKTSIPRFIFNIGFDYGYQAGWRARMDTMNPICSPEAVDETLAGEAAAHEDLQALTRTVARQHDRISAVESMLSQYMASITASVGRVAEGQTRVESEWKIQGQKYTADLRRVSHVNGELVERVVVLEAENATNKDSLRELRDLGQRAFDRLEKLEQGLSPLYREGTSRDTKQAEEPEHERRHREMLGVPLTKTGAE